MVDTFFSYGMVTDDDVKFYKAVPGTMKITGIKATDKGVVNIPETIDGLPVTYYEGLHYFGDPIKKLILPKTLVALTSTEYFPEIVGELVIDNDNPKWSTDGVSLLSKDGTKLLRMCQKNRESYTIPDGVTTICFYAFKFNNNVELTIPDSVTTVEGSAFKYCSSLKTVHGGKSIANYESSSFDDTEWYKSSPVLVLGTTLLRFDSMEENVVVPEGIEVIGPKAFSSSGGKNVIMESVKLPSTVREIGEYAFSNKKNLKAINFPDGLQTIRRDAFNGCQSLSEIVLPDSITEIGVEAFQGCSSVTKVVIPHAVSGTKTDNFLQEKVEAGLISAGAFSGCSSLESIEIPEGTVAIGASAFNNCRSLKNIHIPQTVKAIGKEAFANCFELEELFLPANCVELGQRVLPHATTGWGARSAKFSKIGVDPQNEEFSSLDGVLCSKNGDKLIACPSQYNVVDYTIPEGVKEILPGAFEGCEKIKKVVFAKTVEIIGAKAFASMTALEEIVLPPDYPVLGDGLFMGCTNLKFITWPNNVREIGEKCFDHTGIENLTIPETVETIGKYAFAFIKAERVRLPKTVKDISLSIFAGVPEIEVYDTIDSEAKPAAEYLDDTNGGFNGKVGFIGIHQKENYIVAACNANWHEHTIIVRSAEDDSEKYRVRMPNGQKRKVYCTYASSWGKHAEFNFSAVDNIFKDLTADAKLDYAFNRLHWQAGISEEMLSTLNKYVAKNAKDIAARVFKTDAVDDLVMLESFGIVKKNTIDERIDEATKANAMKCTGWLLNWQNSNLSSKEKAAKAEKSLSTGALTVAEIKKIWPHKKSADGGLTITGYNGKDVDVRVPEIIGKTPVTAIADSCFSDNKDKDQKEFLRTQLRSVEIPDSVVDIGSMAFWYCKGLERVILPKKIKTISRSLFCKCKNLSIDIPSGITEIQDSAFEGCPMKSMTVPASVKAIGETAFGECRGGGTQGMPNLESIEVDPASKYFKSVDGVLFSSDGKTLVKYPQAKTLESYEIPDGVTKISKNAFASVDALKSVTIPESVDAIEDDAFSKCGNLEIVSMPEMVSTFGSAFDECASLKEIVVPKGVTELPGGCFAGCKSLTKVGLPKGLKKIGFQAFMDCENLSDVNVPASVRGIGEKAFKGCKALKDIAISRSTTGIGWGIFRECDNLTIHTPAGSKMYTYAKTEKIKIEELIESTDEEDIPKSKPKKAPTKVK